MALGTGRTTKAMLEAPLGATFVWCNGNLTYPKGLAKSIGRNDLNIVGPVALERGYLRGLEHPPVVDHATVVTSWMREELQSYG